MIMASGKGQAQTAELQFGTESWRFSGAEPEITTNTALGLSGVTYASMAEDADARFATSPCFPLVLHYTKREQIGNVEAFIEKTNEKLSQILGSQELRRISISWTRPAVKFREKQRDNAR